MTVHDDILALNSPAAALMNSLGTTGLTPLGGAADGLGITTGMNGGPVRSIAAPMNPEAERLHRAHMVMDTLKSRVGGHGITRDGVERIAQLQGFTTLWDDDNLTIAGNCVDLEINFNAGGSDGVRDVSLKLNISDNTSESEEPQFQELGTQVIKDNLQSLAVVNGLTQWRGLEAFASNLQYLSQLDRIETGSPCFSAVGDLYHTFQQIWNAEKERFKGRSHWQHLRRSAAGRPAVDRKPKLGLVLDYWASNPNPVQNLNTATDDTIEGLAELCSAHISCEPGLPATAMIKTWVSDLVLMEDSDSMLDTDRVSIKPDWRNPVQDPESLMEKQNTDETGVTKSAEMTPTILDLHFYCELIPEVYLPLNVAANLNVDHTMLSIDEDSTITYQAALHKHFDAHDMDDNRNTPPERWSRSLPVPDEENPDKVRVHSYALHSTQNAPPLWCYPVTHLNFTHPKQVAAVLPVLRQYLVLWRLLQSLVVYSQGGTPSTPANTRVNGLQSDIPLRPLRRTNKKDAGFKLQDLLKVTGSLSADDSLPIDLTLDVLSDLVKARLDVYVPILRPYERQQKGSFIVLALCVCQDGVIEVRDLHGVPLPVVEGSDVRSKLVHILEATEDIGIAVEWLLKQVSLHA